MTVQKNTEKADKKVSNKGNNVALKDFHLFCPPHDDIKILKGDDVSNVPEKYTMNLITEGVLKG